MGQPKLTDLELRIYNRLLVSPISGRDARSWEKAALNRLVAKGLAKEEPSNRREYRRWVLATLGGRLKEIEKKLGNVEFYSPTMPLHWKEYHDIIRELITALNQPPRI